mgnify:CR=1 FL=1
MSFKHHKQMSESFLTAAFLSVSGGLQDAYTYIFRGKVFANAQTGNIVLLSQSIIDKDFVRAIHYLVPLLFFALGIAMCHGIKLLAREEHLHWRQLALAIEVLVLVGVSFVPEGHSLRANGLTSFACGIQVQAFRKFHGRALATTMCIGNLRSGTEHLFRWLHHREGTSGRSALVYYGLILSFVAGAVLSGLLTPLFGTRTVLTACLPLLLSLALMFRLPDPT